ncbi:hypothetical protein [Streptomyces luteireticuli]|uniref:Uncharacterized protein n=1 Tax=Streptomyces luteireticuli TaxID=173858 RepID=A0ABP3I325_9ACTN
MAEAEGRKEVEDERPAQPAAEGGGFLDGIDGGTGDRAAHRGPHGRAGVEFGEPLHLLGGERGPEFDAAAQQFVDGDGAVQRECGAAGTEYGGQLTVEPVSDPGGTSPPLLATLRVDGERPASAPRPGRTHWACCPLRRGRPRQQGTHERL